MKGPGESARVLSPKGTALLRPGKRYSARAVARSPLRRGPSPTGRGRRVAKETAGRRHHRPPAVARIDSHHSSEAQHGEHHGGTQLQRAAEDAHHKPAAGVLLRTGTDHADRPS